MKNKQRQTILVTGHAGFIGSHLAEKLLEKGYQVIGIDNFNNYYNPQTKKRNIKNCLQHKGFKQYRLDILDQEKLRKVFETNKIDLIIHLAARAGVRPSIAQPKLYQQVNVQGTKNLLELARKFKVKQFIFGSSSSVYGNQRKIPFTESDKIGPALSPYAASKQKAEKLCQEYARKYGLKITILRFFTVYGPRGRPDMAPYLFSQKILASKPIIKFGDGRSRRDYTYIDDIIAGILAAIKKPFKFEIINLGNNQPVSLNEFISLLENLTKKKAKIIARPRHPADVKQTWANISKAKRLLGWRPQTGLAQGLRQFLRSEF